MTAAGNDEQVALKKSNQQYRVDRQRQGVLVITKEDEYGQL